MEFNDEHIEAIIYEGNTSERDNNVLPTIEGENSGRNFEDVVTLLEENESLVSRKQGHEDGCNDVLLSEVDQSNKKFKFSHSRKLNHFAFII